MFLSCHWVLAHWLVCPLTSTALALAESLGFAEVSQNSIDAVSDRDFAAEYLFCATMIGIHLSKLAEQIVLYTSAEFGFFELVGCLFNRFESDAAEKKS